MKLGVRESLLVRNFLINSQSLKTLILYGNQFGVEGARNLADGLKQNGSLEQLDLGCNRIRNKGASAIAESILSNNSVSPMKVLGLKNNFISEKGFKRYV